MKQKNVTKPSDQKSADHTRQFNSLFTKYERLVYSYCLRFLRLPYLAEEATADVFFLLWRKQEVFSQYEKIEPLIYKLAKDTAFNYLKKIARNRDQREQFIRQYELQLPKTGEQVVLETEKLHMLNHMIDSLPGRRKQIFRMRYLEGKDNQTIAKQLQISSNTVKVQLNKGKQALKKQLLANPGFSSLLSIMLLFSL